MAISAFLQQPSGQAGARRDARRRLKLRAEGARRNGTGINVAIHNISATGLLIESDAELAVDDRIDIDLPHAGSIPARLIWASGRLFGCQFDTPVSPAVLSAAQLRSAVDAERPADAFSYDDAAPTLPAAERFGTKLQRLRIAKGLSQSDVAARMGVSAPSISGWEKGRARPRHDRIGDLAQLLDVPVSQLLGDPAPEQLHELISRSREQIARATGISPDNIRIVIEL